MELCRLNDSVKPKQNHIRKRNSHKTNIDNDSGHAQKQNCLGLAANQQEAYFQHLPVG